VLEADHSLLSRIDIRNTWSYTSTPPHVSNGVVINYKIRFQGVVLKLSKGQIYFRMKLDKRYQFHVKRWLCYKNTKISKNRPITCKADIHTTFNLQSFE
jgi:hypothetical protein